MARTKTPDDKFTQYYAAITKTDDEKRLVYGYASTEALDAQGEITKLSAIQDALGDYMKFANIREMHQLSAVGTAQSVEMDDKGLYLCAKVVDDNAWKKVKEGVYKGFSIGGRAIQKTTDGVRKIVEKMRLSEISLVDRPANPEAVFDVWKRDDTNKGDGEVDAEPLGTQTDEEKKLEAEKNKTPKAEGGEQVNEKDKKDKKDENEFKKYAGEELWDTNVALQALMSISALLTKEMQEDHAEAPGQAADLKLCVERLKAFIASEVMEEDEDDELKAQVVALSEQITDLKKSIQKEDTMLCAKCAAEINMKKVDEADKTAGAQQAASADINKSIQEGEIDMKEEDIQKMVSDSIAKAMEPVVKENAELKDKIAKMEAAPAAAKAVLSGATMTIEKAADTVLKADPVPAVTDPDNIAKADRRHDALSIIKANIVGRAGARDPRELANLGVKIAI